MPGRPTSSRIASGRLRGGKGLLAAADADRREPLRLEALGDAIAHRQVVVDDQNGLRHSGCGGSKAGAIRKGDGIRTIRARGRTEVDAERAVRVHFRSGRAIDCAAALLKEARR
jgi:hypothetical protein